MAEPTAVPHDFDIPYLEHDLGEVAVVFNQRVAIDRRRVVVEGPCPRCKGHTVTEYPWGVPGGGTKGLLERTGNRPEQVDVLGTEVLYCECGYPHPNQPATPVFLGCGASWRVSADR